MGNTIYNFFWLLFTFICITTDSAIATIKISQEDSSPYTGIFGQVVYPNAGQGQSLYVNESGWITQIQIYLIAVKGDPATDEIFCELRDSKGIVLESSSIYGFSIGEGWKSFNFNNKVTPGNYIFTCYLYNFNKNEDHDYRIHFNVNNNSYPNGKRYVSISENPQDWNAWYPSPGGGDLRFRVIIETEMERTPKKPSIPQGPAYGNTKTSYTYTTSTTDPNHDQIIYIFDWGDRTEDQTYSVNSGSMASANHIWTDPGKYIIKVRAKDSGGLISYWSNELTVTIITPIQTLAPIPISTPTSTPIPIPTSTPISTPTSTPIPIPASTSTPTLTVGQGGGIATPTPEITKQELDITNVMVALIGALATIIAAYFGYRAIKNK